MHELEPTTEEIKPLTEATLPEYPTPDCTVAAAQAFNRSGELPKRYTFTSEVRAKMLRSRILFRRCLTAQLHLMNRWTQQQIADYLAEQYPDLKVTAATVSSDICESRRIWEQSCLMNTATACENEVAKLDALEASLTQLYEEGDVATYADQMLKVAKRRSALLGFDKAKKLDVSVRPLEDLSDAELEQIIRTGSLKEVADAENSVHQAG